MNFYFELSLQKKTSVFRTVKDFLQRLNEKILRFIWYFQTLTLCQDLFEKHFVSFPRIVETKNVILTLGKFISGNGRSAIPISGVFLAMLGRSSYVHEVICAP